MIKIVLLLLHKLVLQMTMSSCYCYCRKNFFCPSLTISSRISICISTIKCESYLSMSSNVHQEFLQFHPSQVWNEELGIYEIHKKEIQIPATILGE